ncbi:APC family permease [Mycolicibacterium smegmatis]|uniref:Amino acid permease-associated region n=3 Tax=Mycolicibacterium smegmatis TaxID=1772 RepID=I7FHQ8_MYCS2|nr:APC family permease [Mycolicibacterium smegmatis]ABK76120.1 amino acid permease-associated region, putative [Mycolicibacterium smegmatis MC2 155]AFP40890.1 Amino acid permease-associated region [Mycolicibacterium smegmatis MC2 155]AIU09620.1 amino acid permease [Mycolicibacterium smegmatis MC2 155]AIU16245.1 amino acid permease [Mycolicibacterium smegmatis]AIU22868.1 amino acid permease [Mycolicibacterium smegmatis]
MTTTDDPTAPVGGRALTAAESTGLERDALGPWGVFAQGLAAAAPSVAVAVVPFALFVAAGKGAAWAAVIGLLIVVLVALTISFQARRTVSSGSLGTYTGNGLGPGFAFAAGFSLLFGYIGFATTGTLGGVLYLDAFLESIGLGSQAIWFKLLLVAVVVGVAVYLPYRGVSVAARYELAFELLAIASILVIIVASYIGYGFRIDWEQWKPQHLGSSATFIAAVTAVGSYAGFESVASLGAEAKNAHRNIARSLLRVVILLGVLYIFATYPQILHFDDIDGDKAVLPQLADSVGVAWVNQVVSGAVAIAFIVFVTAVTTAAARSLFTFAHEGALPRVFTKVHEEHKTPWAGVVFVGIVAYVFSVAATFSSAGRLVFDVYGGYVANWGFLTSYLLVVIATPIWLRKINALTPWHLVVSIAATVGLGYVIVSNFYPVPEFPFNILPFVFGVILLAGLAWYWYLKRTRPEIAQRIGTIQTLSEEEQRRLADEGIVDVLDGEGGGAR